MTSGWQRRDEDVDPLHHFKQTKANIWHWHLNWTGIKSESFYLTDITQHHCAESAESQWELTSHLSWVKINVTKRHLLINIRLSQLPSLQIKVSECWKTKTTNSAVQRQRGCDAHQICHHHSPPDCTALVTQTHPLYLHWTWTWTWDKELRLLS